jgi:cob(I)alamin adenosyltransferase
VPRLTKIYTRTGDDGSTGLGGGQRVPKDSLRIDAYGTVDELNSGLGVAITAGLDATLKEMLGPIQNDLFHLGSDLCVLEEDKVRYKIPQIEARHVAKLEAHIDLLQESLKPLENFILPGGTAGAAHLHVCRCVCRRAERDIIRLQRVEQVGPEVVRYVNRLSDLLFVMARYENLKKGATDVLWDSHA